MQTPRSGRSYCCPKYPATKYAENPQQKAPSDEFSTAKSSKLRFGFFINSLLGLKFLYLLNKYQSSAQSKIANIATKAAILSTLSKGKTAKIKATAHQSSKKTIGTASKYLAVL